MRSIVKLVAATLALTLAFGGVALAGDQVRQHDRVHDGSCGCCVAEGDQVRQQDRLKDGSCDGCQVATGDQVQHQYQYAWGAA